MDDSPETSSASHESINLHKSNVNNASSQDLLPGPLPPPNTQTLDRFLSFHGLKEDDHAHACMSSNEIAQKPSETQCKEEEIELSNSLEPLHEEEQIELLKSTESLEDFDEPVLSPMDVQDNDISESSSPLVVKGSTDILADETEACVSNGRSEIEVYKPSLSIASSFSSWDDDACGKPSMVGAGLANLGNTCFLNAVLQCFTHTVLLIQGLHSFTHVTPCGCNSGRFCLFCALWEHVELSLSSMDKVLSPLKFVDNLSYFSSSFQRFQQEDAHEFLQCFLDRLESSFMNLKAKDNTISSQNENLVKQVFGGRVVSKLRCCNCNHCSDTYEPSVDLSLEIEDANNLSTALKSFTKVEYIEDQDMKFTCEKCKEKVSVEKQLMLDHTPPICAFHLKRFKNYGSYVEKIDKHVEFPLVLDLQPYTSGTQINDVDLKYELYAVVVHTAFTSTCGHYYSYIRTAPDTWYKFDDSKVTKVSEACVLSEEAYILFYARQGTPWFSDFMETYKMPLHPRLSNTSPKSVLDNVDHTSDAANNHSHNVNETSKTKDHIFSESFNRSREYKDNSHLFPSTMPIPSNSSGVKASNDTVKVVSPSVLKENETFDIDKVFSPATPPRSPGLDLSDNEISEVVFAAKADQLKMAEKSSNKRQRNKDVEDSTKREALKLCRKMPGARGSLLLAALGASSRSEGSFHNRSKTTTSPPRKNRSRSSDRFRHSDNSISRNLAISSFR